MPRLLTLSPALALACGGCSLLYNPSNLPQPAAEAGVDAASDAEVILDADPAALALDGLYPATLVEGAGVGGSAPALLTLSGMQFVPGADTVVGVVAHDGTSDITKITVDNSKLAVAADGRQLVVPITIDVDPTRGAGTTLALDVTLTQSNGLGGHVMKQVPGADGSLTIDFLDELTDDSLAATAGKLPTGVHDYAKVDVATTTIKPNDTAAPLVIRSHSSLSIAMPIDVSAAGQTPGPGGAKGGGGGAAGGVGSGQPGTKGGGMGGGLPSSAGGGLGTMGGDGDGPSTGGPAVANPAIVMLGDPWQGAGGSGGHGGATLGAPGGAGGAGGGTIELSAAGTLMAPALTSKGGGGVTTGNINAPGGSGSGGVILLRGGASVTSGTLTVTGAPGGGSFGAGGDGIVRVDKPVADIATPAQYHGPMFMTYPQITDDSTPPVVVVGTKNAAFSYYYIDAQGAIDGPYAKTIGTTGTASFDLEELPRGISHVCLLVNGGNAQSPAEAQNCVDIAYMYKP